MWAVVVNVTFKDSSTAKSELDNVVATVKQAPGFVAGYWVQLDDHNGTSIVVFDADKEQVTAAAPREGTTSPGGVTFSSVKIGEVLAHA